ncbi:DUF1642 domain-containing protein [Companilactobacillus mishanensis]|uniref:DUF1642 domain-containing protein n=1 Tax=Companilactobacillus mishanensis TaxID=2486008 RepID=A0A5P0ZGJ9_9LACO|nr:DUF1642 domain-containing protein [Companilactobacillus mishanensis]MQS52152.1 DUF1642 domain-containing protein [Companilactobacillus mishanensis]
MREIDYYPEDVRKDVMKKINYMHKLDIPITAISNGLLTRYAGSNEFDQWQMLQDIIDIHNGEAKFAEKKYYVKLADNGDTFLNQYSDNKRTFISDNKEWGGEYKTKFTMSEIEAIDPRYKQFAIPVEEIDD